ncbi:hypothetical protein VTJ83DRAFT_6490 [Remersonia thermophila]|uniref:Phosphoglycerate mutase n=1 Tax=Remersonia thermophila TaxID=72144 RepID=A0ABR4D4V0_9PEZI
MGRPRLIIVIRHAQSEGNKNRDIHQTVPDHRVKLTQEGWQQAYDAGRRLRAMLRPDDTLHFFTSPYRRTRETTEGILATLTSDDPEPSPFKRENIKVYEEPRLREQDFGNFQPCSAEMERMWQERADYGHFFYRIPNGESAADAYDRISGFNESLWRQFGEDDFASVCVLVTHGLMSRVFLMKWYHFSVEHFEDLRNINHCEFLIMRRNDQGKYILENKLRTWSDLKRERAAQLAKSQGNASSKDMATLARTGSIEVRRRWGGCPNGCNHDKSFRVRSTLADLVKADHMQASSASGLTNGENDTTANGGSSSTAAPAANGTTNGTTTPAANGTTNGATVNPSFNGTANSTQTPSLITRRPTASKRFRSPDEAADGDQNGTRTPGGPRIDIDKAREELVSSPDATPSFISVDDRLRAHLKSPNLPPPPNPPASLGSVYLHVGRDFGGTYSGHSDDGDDVGLSSDDDINGARSRGVPPLGQPSAAGDSKLDPAAAAVTTTTATTTTTTTTTTAAAAAAAVSATVTIPTGTATSSSSSASQSAAVTPRPGSLKGPAATGATSMRPHRPHRHVHGSHNRPPSRMGRGMRANRLGDHHSSDGEHEADTERDQNESDGDACSVCGEDGDDESNKQGASVKLPLRAKSAVGGGDDGGGGKNASVPAAAPAAAPVGEILDDADDSAPPPPPGPLPPAAVPSDDETQELADEADEKVLLKEEEREEKTVMGSVF